MALRPISEQVFRTRRKDRKMVWVDAAAVLFGLVLLLATVGGVVLVEPKPEPITWDYSFYEATDKQKHCIGIKDVIRAGCTFTLPGRTAFEGEELTTTFNPIVAANVTSILFTLTWVDDTPVTERPDCTTECDRQFNYDNSSTDTLEVVITPPIGDPITLNGTSSVDSKLGSLNHRWSYLSMPEPGRTEAFTQFEAMSALNTTFRNPEHDGLGLWSAKVTVVRAGDQEGTLPMNACSGVPVDLSGLPNEAGNNCDLEGEQSTLENNDPPPPSTVYTASYDDKGNPWILEMAVRSYEVQTSFAG